MDDTAKFWGIFDAHPTRSNAQDRLRIRDAGLIADVMARLSDLAGRDNRGWTVAVSPVHLDLPTERSLCDVTLTSPQHGIRSLPLRIARDWIEIGSGVMESSIRDSRNLQAALERAFRRLMSETPIPAA